MVRLNVTSFLRPRPPRPTQVPAARPTHTPPRSSEEAEVHTASRGVQPTPQHTTTVNNARQPAGWRANAAKYGTLAVAGGLAGDRALHAFDDAVSHLHLPDIPLPDLPSVGDLNPFDSSFGSIATGGATTLLVGGIVLIGGYLFFSSNRG